MKALLIIDVQRDFCPGGALAVEQGDQVVPVINSLSPRFPISIATQDWHPKNHVSFASSHGKSPGNLAPLPDGEGEQILWPDHCVQGTPGADFHPLLDTRGCSLILRKGTNPGIDSYSAFLENDKKTTTGLAGWLKEKGVKTLYLCGLATDYCVFFSVMDALENGFKAALILDAVRGVDFPPGNVENTLGIMKKAGVRLIRSEEIENV